MLSSGSLGESTLMRAADVGEIDADVTVDVKQQQQLVVAEPLDEEDTTLAGQQILKTFD